MQKQAIPKEPVASYKEVRIGKTLYRVTSVFSGEKDLGRTLEQLAVRRAMTDVRDAIASILDTMSLEQFVAVPGATAIIDEDELEKRVG